MIIKSYEELLDEKEYSQYEIKNSFLIIHPEVLEKYWLVRDQVSYILEEWSNFTQLENPIIDEFGNEYWDSEWYYMSQRISDLNIKKLIAFCSIWKGLSKKSAYLYESELDRNPHNRIDFMRKAIKEKFDKNPKLREVLLQTGNKDIIEYTFWEDIFFWIDCKTKKWANILWKLLVEYRDNFLNSLII